MNFGPHLQSDEPLSGPDSNNLYQGMTGQHYIKTEQHVWPVKYLGPSFNTRAAQVYLTDPASGDTTMAQVINVSGKWRVIDPTRYYTTEAYARQVFKRYAIKDPALINRLMDSSWSERNSAQLHWIDGKSYIRHILTYSKKASSGIVFNRVIRQADNGLEILKSDGSAGVNTGHFLYKSNAQWKLIAGLKGGTPVELSIKPNDHFMKHADAKQLYSYDYNALKPGAPPLADPAAEETRQRLYHKQYSLFQRAMHMVMMLERKPANWSYQMDTHGQITVPDVIQQTYQHARGMIVGENLVSVAAKKFLYLYMGELKRAGVTTIYIEGIVTEMWAEDLQRYNAMEPQASLPPILRTGLGIADQNNNHQHLPFNRVNLIEVAHAYGIRVIGLDALVTDTGIAAQDNELERLILFNYLAANIIQHGQKAYPGKWLAFTGLAHISEVNGTPGLSEILRVPAVRVSDQAEGDTNVSLDESFFIYEDKEVSFVSRQDVHVRMNTGISLDRDVPFLALDEFFISPRALLSYRTSLQPGEVQTSRIIWHLENGHFSLQNCPDNWIHVKGKQFRTTQDFIKAMEMDSMTFTDGPEVLAIGPQAQVTRPGVRISHFLQSNSSADAIPSIQG